MMGWADIFPETLAPSIHTPHGTCFLDDYYCCTSGCKCTEVQLAIISAGSAAEVLGSASLDYRSGRVTLQPEPGLPHNVLQEVFNGFFEQHPDLRAELRRRGEFMAGPVATYVNESVALRPSRKPSQRKRSRSVAPPPAVVAKVAGIPFTRVGRNESCPCGSGRKYKKCCLALSTR
ncbi:SEC-C domain-containing protein [bacterium]|nr:SEC-C domain-containing protein [bacterium]